MTTVLAQRIRLFKKQFQHPWWLTAASLLVAGAPALQAGTVAYWRFEGDGTNTPTAGQLVDTFASHTAVQSDGLLAVDTSGNGNTIYGWGSGWNGFWIEYESPVPGATVMQTSATNQWSLWTDPNGYNYPAIATWSAKSNPAGTNLETITPKAWTIEASINLDLIGYAYASGNNHTFIGRDGNHVASNNSNLAPLYFQVNGASGNLTISFADKAGNFYTVADPSGLSVNQWYNVAAVSDGTNLFLYKDTLDGTGYQLIGKTALTSTNTALAVPTGSYATMSDGSTWAWTLARGRYGTGTGPSDDHADRFYGYIDEVRISDAALRPSQFLFAPTNVYVVQGPTPTNQVVPLGSAVSFSVIPGGVNAKVQWQHAGTNIIGATNLTYAIASTVAGQAGNYDVVITNNYGAITSSLATLTFHVSTTLTWAGTAGTWDTSTTDWTTNKGVGSLAYIETDNVRFDDFGAAQPTVTLSTALNPTSITVSNASYLLTASSIVSGSLTVGANGTLILDTPDTSTGPTTTKSTGVLQLGNGDSGLTLATGPITNNGALNFNLAGDVTISQAIHGSGNITNLGSAGALFLLGNVSGSALTMSAGPAYAAIVLQGSNSLSGPITINSGVIYPQSTGALGSAPVIINSGGTLYMNYNVDLAGSALTLAGGLLEKGGNGPTTFGGAVTLTTDSTISIDGGATLTLTNAAGISSSGNTLTVAGGGYASVSGPLALNTGSLTKNGNATLVLAGTNNDWFALSINAGILQIGDGGANGSLGGGSIANNATLDFNSSANLTVTNEIDGSGAVVKDGTGTVSIASSANTYGGTTTVNSGTLLVNGVGGYGTYTVNGGTLGGTGAVNAATFVLPGATLAPGAGTIGTLTINGDLTLGGNLAVKVNKSLPQSNDLVVVTGSLSNTNTGRVSLQNLGPALKPGDTFQLFSQPVATGNLLVLSTAGGVLWSNNLAVDGAVSVLSTNVPHPVVRSLAITPTSLVVGGTNGLANGIYYVLTTTNLALSATSWTIISTNVFDASGNFKITNTITPSTSQSFFRLELQ